MSTPRIVPAFDEVEDGEARVGLRAEAFAIEQLALERAEEDHLVLLSHLAKYRSLLPPVVDLKPKAQRVPKRGFVWGNLDAVRSFADFLGLVGT